MTGKQQVALVLALYVTVFFLALIIVTIAWAVQL